MKYRYFDLGERRERGACGKVVFTKKDAATKRNWLLNHGKEEYLRIYSCGKCRGGWHLTSREDLFA